MTELSVVALTIPDLSVRPLARRDARRVILLAQRVGTLPWTDGELAAVLAAPDTLGCVAEVRGGIAGFVVGAADPPLGPPGPPTAAQLVRLFRRFVGAAVAPPRIDRLAVTVAPDFPTDAVEHALLRQFVRELSRSADCAEVAVPETSLTAQLMLRDAGFRATRVLRGHYGDEDGYLMVRPRGPTRDTRPPPRPPVAR